MTREEAIKEIKSWNFLNEKETEAIETLIPELRESEDEIHRKWILEYLYDGLRKSDEQFKEQFKSAIAWLEKQKESLHISETCKENTDSFTDEDEDRTINGCLLAANAERRCKRASEELLEELGLADYTKFFYEQGVEKGKKEREKQKEQKPTERSLEDDHIIGFVYDLLNEIEWKDNWAMSKDECLRLLNNYSPQKPAEWDKLQADFRNINEAFEDGKKEVVDNPEKYGLCRSAEWSRQSIIEALTKWLTEKIAPLHKKSLDKTITEREEMFMAALLEMRSLVNSPDFKFRKDMPAEWSEEDEKVIGHLIEALPMWANGQIAMLPSQADKYVDWLKSLRPQPKQRWTDEDDRICHLIMANLSESTRHAITLPMDTVNMFNNWLRTLQCMPPLFTDWTDEDETLLSDALGCVIMVQEIKKRGELKNFHISCTGEELRSWIRSLKSRPRKQPHWKPSEEQMRALDEYIWAKEPNKNKAKDVISLYEDLKKLM